MKLEAGRESDKEVAIMRIARRLSAASPHGDLPCLIALTDSIRLRDPAEALAALPPGAGLVWRTYDIDVTREALGKIGRAAHARRCLLLIAGAGVHGGGLIGGVHLPERAVIHPSAEGRVASVRQMRRGLVVTAAAHSHRAIIAAARAGVDAVLISPVFPTASHPGAAGIGVLRFAQLARLARDLGLAPYALGGVTSRNAGRLLGSGAAGIAGIGFLRSGLQR